MVHLLKIPENVMILHLLPLLNHNDILRLRRVSKQTKAFADSYLWTPKPTHQRKWDLEIDPKEGKTLRAFLKSGLPPPPSWLRISLEVKHETRKQQHTRRTSFFEDDHLEEFMKRYSKYVTRLSVDVLRLPFTNLKEIQFYESLVNLENLCAHKISTVGGAAEFEKKTKNAQGSFLIRPTFKKLKILSLLSTDCMDTMWNFINGVSDNLVELAHPFKSRNGDGDSDSDSDSSDDSDDDDDDFSVTMNLPSVRSLIERRRLTNHNPLLYDWAGMHDIILQPSELFDLFAICRENGVMIKNLVADFLGDLEENYGRNLFVGNIIHSLVGFHDDLFLVELPALVNIEIHGTSWVHFQTREGYPEWPNLKKIYVRVNDMLAGNLLQFLCASPQLKRPNLEELYLNYSKSFKICQLPVPCSKDLANCCGNLKKLTLNRFSGDNNFFIGLWEGLPLLEEINLFHCPKLTNKGFVGNGVGGTGTRPVFLKLKNLKNLGIHNLTASTRITNAAFRKVFRHLKLVRFEFCSDEPLTSITITGIKDLLTGSFAKTIEKLDLDGLVLRSVSAKELRKVVSCFRSSKML